MANINLHWFEDLSERLNIDIDLDLKKDIVYEHDTIYCTVGHAVIVLLVRYLVCIVHKRVGQPEKKGKSNIASNNLISKMFPF